MKKIGQTVKIKTAVIKKRKKLVPADYDGPCEVKAYTILCAPTESNPFYMILVDPEWLDGM